MVMQIAGLSSYFAHAKAITQWVAIGQLHISINLIVFPYKDAQIFSITRLYSGPNKQDTWGWGL